MKLKTPKVPQELQDEVEIIETNGISSGSFASEPDIFYFTNNSNEDWTTQWNKIIYTFPKKKTVRMYIQDATPLEVQNIRKMFAYRFAQDQFLKSAEYKHLVALGKGTATSYSDKLFQPWIDECLKPLPKAKLQVQELEENQEANFKATKPVSKSMSLNEQFKDQEIPEFGQM